VRRLAHSSKNANNRRGKRGTKKNENSGRKCRKLSRESEGNAVLYAAKCEAEEPSKEALRSPNKGVRLGEELGQGKVGSQRGDN